MKKLLLPFVFLWGVALRAVEVLNGNFIFNFDAGRDLLVARSIVVEHKLTLIGAQLGSGSAGVGALFQGPGYYYLLAIAYAFFHGNPYGALLMMFLFGAATLVAVYWTAHQMFGREVAILILFLTGISPLIASQSRFIWAPHPASLFIVLSLYFTYMIAKKPRLFAPLAILSAGFTYHFELAMTVPMVVALWICLPLIFRVKDVKTYLWSLGATVFAFLPMILFDSRHGWMEAKALFSYEVPQGPVGKDVWFLRIMDHSRPYISSAVNSFPTDHALLPPVAFIALIAGLCISLILLAWRSKDIIQRRFFQFMLLLTVATYVILLLLNNFIWDYYLIHLHFIYIFLFAYVLVLTWRLMKKKMWARVGFVVLVIFLVCMAVGSVWRVYEDYHFDYFDYGGFEKIKGKEAAVDYVYHDATGKPFNEFTFMPPIYTYPYDYLFQTYALRKYGYMPGHEKKGTVYLIIERDPSKPWTYKGWLETVIRGGTIIYTRTLPSGQIIQKREFLQ